MIIRKVLVFKASSIGDALMAKHFLENVHALYPDARCGLLVAGRGGMVRSLLAAYSWIEVIEVNRRNIVALLKLIWIYRGSDVVMTSYVKPGGRFGLCSKLVARILARPGRLFGFTDISTWDRHIYDHVLESNMLCAPRLLEEEVLEAAGIPVTHEALSLEYLAQPELLTRLVLEGVPYVAVHLFAGSDGRAMSQKKRQALLNALSQELPGMTFVLTGTASERSFLEELDLPESAKIIAGDLTVQELAAILDASVCVVSVGTGPSHMTSHLGKPLVVLVVCIGIPWCGQEQFGNYVSVKIFSDTNACAEGHRMLEQSPACIEGIDVTEVARATAAYVQDESR